MDLKIKSVHEKGDASKEYVLIDVKADCNAGDFGVADTTFNDNGTVSNRLRHFYWFVKKPLKKGDVIILRTSKGKKSSVKKQDGSTTHTVFWGLDSAVWNDDGDAAILLYIPKWTATKA